MAARFLSSPAASSISHAMNEASSELDLLLPITLAHALHEIVTNLLDRGTFGDAQEHRHPECRAGDALKKYRRLQLHAAFRIDRFHRLRGRLTRNVLDFLQI